MISRSSRWPPAQLLRSNEALPMGPHYYKGSNCFEFHFLETQMSLLMHTHAHIYLCPPHKGGMLRGWWKTKLNSLATYCKPSLMHSVLAPKLIWGSDKESGPWEVKELEDLVPAGHLLKLGSQDCSVLPSEAWYVLSPSCTQQIWASLWYHSI